MRLGIRAKVLTGVGLVIALCAQAAPRPDDPPHDIVVTGHPEANEELRRRATEYVRALGVANGERAAARWLEPVCPKALGLSEAHSRFVEGQIRGVAESLDIATASYPCRPNVTVSFVSQADAIVRRMHSREPHLFREVPLERRPGFFHGSAPIRWWYTTGLRGRDGDRLASFTPPAVQMEGGGSFPMNPDTKVLSQHGSSIVSTQTVRALHSATIIVDVERAEGATLKAVASYAAMVGLAEIRFSDEPRPGSILALFSDSRSEVELTEWDRSLLRELYRLPLDRLARYQRARLIGALLSEPKEPAPSR